jgi:hypothetical protein
MLCSVLVPRRLVAVLALSVLAASPVLAQAPATSKPFEPQVGQAGKDVVWVPTADILVEKMLDMAKVTSEDFVIDLGSGDGRTVIAAAKRGARAMGVEFNPDMVALSRRNAEQAGVAARATFVEGDLFQADLSQATVITMFLLPDINLKLRPKLLDLAPGTRVVSNSFTMGEWEADETARVEGECRSWCNALFWIIPAKVAGMWALPLGELTLQQEFQKVTGTFNSGGMSQAVAGQLRGDEITLTIGSATYTGVVDGGSMKGTVTGGAVSTWNASRVK